MRFKKTTAVILASLCFFSLGRSAAPVMADDSTLPYLALGADLNDAEKATVLDLLDVDPDKMDDYVVVTVTNQEERDYLNEYLDESVIGTRALSSVKIQQTDSGDGIHVTTSNITYCTTGMYQNALVTAGLKDADISVAGPFNISGTAALVGALKAYSSMSGKKIQPDQVEAATAELVTTSELGQLLDDPQKAEELIGVIKEAIVSQGITSPEDVKAIIDEAAHKLEISLSPEDKEKIQSLMEKIGNLNLDMDTIKAQAKELYQHLENLDINITQEDVEGFFATALSWLKSAWHAFKEWIGV